MSGCTGNDDTIFLKNLIRVMVQEQAGWWEGLVGRNSNENFKRIFSVVDVVIRELEDVGMTQDDDKLFGGQDAYI